MAVSARKKVELEHIIDDVHDHHINYFSREIYLHNKIEQDAEINYWMACNVIKNIHILSNQNRLKSILIHMVSPGGCWYSGMSIFNTIRICQNPITMVAYGQASSMSGIVLQAADKRIISKDCEFMIHHGSLDVSSTSQAAAAFIKMNEKNRQRMLEVFSKRALKTSKFFKEKNYDYSKICLFIDNKIKKNGDWYLDAEEALYYGFCDAILGSKGNETLNLAQTNVKFKGEL